MNKKSICGGIVVVFIILFVIGSMMGGGSTDSNATVDTQTSNSVDDPTNDLRDDHTNGIKVEDGKLINIADNEEIGTVKLIKDVDEGESEIYGIDPEAIEKYVSSDPLVKEYIVESDDTSKDGIYWMFGHDGDILFGHDGDIFLAFNPTEKMGNGMLDRMTEFCKTQGIL